MCKYFFPFWDVSLYSHISVFRRSNVLNIDKVQGNIVPFMNRDFGVLKNLCLVKEQRDFLFPRSIHFELTFLSGMRYGSRSVFCIWLFNSSSTIYWKKSVFCKLSFYIFENQLTIYVWANFWTVHTTQPWLLIFEQISLPCSWS